MNKPCTTCKHEPEWKEEFKDCGWYYGQCKLIPAFVQEGSLRKDNEGVLYQNSMSDFFGVDCNLWEAKGKVVLKFCRDTFKEIATLQYENGEYRTDIMKKTFNLIPYEIIGG